MYIHTYIYIHKYIHTHTNIHTYIYTYIHTYINIYIPTHVHTHIHTYIQGPPKKCIHTLTKEKSMLLVLSLIVHHKLNTRYNKAQYKFPVPVQLMEVMKVVAISG